MSNKRIIRIGGDDISVAEDADYKNVSNVFFIMLIHFGRCPSNTLDSQFFVAAVGKKAQESAKNPRFA